MARVVFERHGLVQLLANKYISQLENLLRHSAFSAALDKQDSHGIGTPV
jgi:hypothetical protein